MDLGAKPYEYKGSLVRTRGKGAKSIPQPSVYHTKMHGGRSLGSAHFSELGLRYAFYVLLQT